MVSDLPAMESVNELICQPLYHAAFAELAAYTKLAMG